MAISFFFQAQTELKGTVKDSLGGSIPMINVFVQLKDKTSVIAYTYTNNDGSYSIEINTQGEFLLNISGMSYKKQQITFKIDTLKPQKQIIKNITLKKDVFSLDEVIINIDRPITVKKDTISIKVSEFINGTEEVVEDILKKLPGIVVSKDGNIKVQGKSIEKVMIENDDLFDKGYKLLTKNLNADVISKVEILEHFSDNPILKGIEDSDKVALNITLKKDRKTTLFGNATLGYGTNQFYENKLNLISFNKKTKYYFFGNLNNIGNDPTGDIFQIIYPDAFSGSTYVGDGESARRFIDIGSDYVNLNKNRAKFNNAELASLNGIYNPSQVLRLKGLAFFTSDETDFFKNSIQQYNLDGDSFTNTEKYKLLKKQISVFGKWDAIYSINKNSRLEYQGKYSIINGNQKSDLNFNEDFLNESLDDNSKFTDHRIIYTHKLNKGKAYQITGRYIYDKKPQRYNVNTFLYQDLFPNESNVNGITQKTNSKINFYGFETNYFVNTKTSNFDLKLGIIHKNETLESNFFFIKNSQLLINDDLNYNNDLQYDFTDLYTKLKYKYKFKKTSFHTSLEAHQLYTKLNTTNRYLKDNPFYLVPSIRATWKLNNKNNLSTLYKYTTQNISLNGIYNGYILNGYRNFKRGLGRFEQLSGNLFLTNYTYGNWTSSFLINASFLYQKDNEYKGTKRSIAPSYNQTSTIILNNKEFYSLNLSTDTFIKKLSSNLKLNASTSKNDIQNIVNESQLRNISNINYTYGAEIRSAFKGFFNFHLGSKWIKSKVQTTIEKTNTDNTSFLDLDLIFSKKLSLQIKNEHYYFSRLSNNKHYYFSDINAQYIIKENALKVKLTYNNIWNTNNFANYYISDTNISSTNYRLLPRYLLLKIDFRF